MMVFDDKTRKLIKQLESFNQNQYKKQRNSCQIELFNKCIIDNEVLALSDSNSIFFRSAKYFNKWSLELD